MVKRLLTLILAGVLLAGTVSCTNKKDGEEEMEVITEYRPGIDPSVPAVM